VIGKTTWLENELLDQDKPKGTRHISYYWKSKNTCFQIAAASQLPPYLGPIGEWMALCDLIGKEDSAPLFPIS
jgi:hypothetical protein